MGVLDQIDDIRWWNSVEKKDCTPMNSSVPWLREFARIAGQEGCSAIAARISVTLSVSEANGIDAS